MGPESMTVSQVTLDILHFIIVVMVLAPVVNPGAFLRARSTSQHMSFGLLFPNKPTEGGSEARHKNAGGTSNPLSFTQARPSNFSFLCRSRILPRPGAHQTPTTRGPSHTVIGSWPARYQSSPPISRPEHSSTLVDHEKSSYCRTAASALDSRTIPLFEMCLTWRRKEPQTAGASAGGRWMSASDTRVFSSGPVTCNKTDIAKQSP